MSDSTKQRDRATELAQTDNRAAETVADSVEDPWYRAQALAWVTRYATASDLTRLAKKAMDAAAACDDPFQQAGSSAWIVRALLERDRRELALQMLELSLGAVPRITSPASRSEAVFLLYQAAFSASDEVRHSMLFALAELHDEADHWRATRNFRDALVMAKPLDPRLVEKLAHGRDEQQSRKIQRAVENDRQLPRDFFW